MPTTLISIVAGIALLGILAAMAVPSSNAVQGKRVEETARQLKSLLQLAQSRSVATGITHGVRYDPDVPVFELINANLTATPVVVLGLVNDPISKQPARVTIPIGVSAPTGKPFLFNVMGSAFEVYFDRWGTPINRGLSIVQLTTTSIRFDYEVHQNNVVLSPVTGRVAIN